MYHDCITLATSHAYCSVQQNYNTWLKAVSKLIYLPAMEPESMHWVNYSECYSSKPGNLAFIGSIKSAKKYMVPARPVQKTILMHNSSILCTWRKWLEFYMYQNNVLQLTMMRNQDNSSHYLQKETTVCLADCNYVCHSPCTILQTTIKWNSNFSRTTVIHKW